MLNASASQLDVVRVNLGGRSARLLSTLFFVFAFLLQSNAVQTHIHGLPNLASAVLDSAKVSPPPVILGKKHIPVQNDPDDCPLCQAAFHVNAVFFDAPAAIAPSILYFKLAIAIFEESFAAPYRGHDKEQRGPPRL